MIKIEAKETVPHSTLTIYMLFHDKQKKRRLDLPEKFCIVSCSIFFERLSNQVLSVISTSLTCHRSYEVQQFFQPLNILLAQILQCFFFKLDNSLRFIASKLCLAALPSSFNSELENMREKKAPRQKKLVRNGIPWEEKHQVTMLIGRRSKMNRKKYVEKGSE